LIDLGGGTSDVILFHRGSVRHTFEIAQGGVALTDDLAVTLQVGRDQAEDLKVDHGCCFSGQLGELVTLDVQDAGGQSLVSIGNELICQILEDRMTFIMNAVMANLCAAGVDSLVNRVVLTGGTSLMRGIEALARQIFDCPVRVGAPNYSGANAQDVNDPRLSTAVGLALYGWRHEERAGAEAEAQAQGGAFRRFLNKLFGKE
jgi:cell division protein FtsA